MARDNGDIVHQNVQRRTTILVMQLFVTYLVKHVKTVSANVDLQGLVKEVFLAVSATWLIVNANVRRKKMHVKTVCFVTLWTENANAASDRARAVPRILLVVWEEGIATRTLIAWTD